MRIFIVFFVFFTLSIVRVGQSQIPTASWSGDATNDLWVDADNWLEDHLPFSNAIVFISQGTGGPRLTTSDTVKTVVLNSGKELRHQAGTLSLTNVLSLEGGTSGSRTTYTLNYNAVGGSATLDVIANSLIGNSTGSYSMFSNIGGTHTHGANGELQVAVSTNSVATYSMGGGIALSAKKIKIGVNGTGTLSQTIGAITATDEMILGENSGASGSYTSGSGSFDQSVTIGSQLTIGKAGSGEMVIDGENFTLTVPVIRIANSSGSEGALTILDGEIVPPMSSLVVYVSQGGTGDLEYAGGTFQPNTINVYKNSTIRILADWMVQGNFLMTGGTVLVGDNMTSPSFTITSGGHIGPAASGDSISIRINP